MKNNKAKQLVDTSGEIWNQMEPITWAEVCDQIRAGIEDQVMDHTYDPTIDLVLNLLHEGIDE